MQDIKNTKTATKPLSAKAVEQMNSAGVIADIEEYAGLRLKRTKSRVKTLFYRYRSPETGDLSR